MNQNEYFKKISISKIILGLVILFFKINTSYSQVKGDLEDFIVASHFYIISYTNWKSELDNINVCIDKSHNYSKKMFILLHNKKTNGKELILKELNENNFNSTCSVIILGADKEKNKLITNAVKSLPILTISNEDDITESRGDVFLVSGKPPKINLNNLKNKSLRIDSNLLNISEVIN
jgi:hypothetical protein